MFVSKDGWVFVKFSCIENVENAEGLDENVLEKIASILPENFPFSRFIAILHAFFEFLIILFLNSWISSDSFLIVFC